MMRTLTCRGAAGLRPDDGEGAASAGRDHQSADDRGLQQLALAGRQVRVPRGQRSRDRPAGLAPLAEDRLALVGVVPPQIPSCSPLRSAQARHGARSGHPAHACFASCPVWWPGPGSQGAGSPLHTARGRSGSASRAGSTGSSGPAGRPRRAEGPPGLAALMSHPRPGGWRCPRQGQGGGPRCRAGPGRGRLSGTA